jgi:hypothetical protein
MKRLLFVVMCVIVLLGCGWVHDNGIREAYKICQPHGGVERISPTTVDSSYCEVECKNGTWFKIGNTGRSR